MTVERELSRFSVHLWLMAAMPGVFVVTGIVYVRAEKAIDRANEVHQESVLLAEEATILARIAAGG